MTARWQGIATALAAALALTAAGIGNAAQTKPQAKSVPSKPSPTAPAPAPTAPGAMLDTEGRHVLILEAETGTVLFSKSAEDRMPPASMSKIMTSYVIFSLLKEGRLHLNDDFPVSQTAWKLGGSKMFVGIGARIKVDDLIKGMLIQSGNDACVVLAEGVAGSETAFADLMNQKAAEIGLKDSHFANATGMPDPNDWMSARDLATLAVRVMRDFPEYYHYFSEKDFNFNNIDQGNRNPLLYKNIGADGLKTGHTEESGYSLIASVVRGDRRVILVVSGLPSMKARASESERLIEWAFREFNNYKLFSAGEKIDDAEVWLGAEPKVAMVLRDELSITLPRRARRDMKVSIVYDKPVPAPVKQGDQLGKLIVTVPDMPTMRAAALCRGKCRADRHDRPHGDGRGLSDLGQPPLTARGYFITLEGGEGAGKSTQAKLLVAALKHAGVRARFTREPGGSPGAEVIRHLLIEGETERWDALGEALLLYAARREHVTRLIQPAIDAGTWIVCDRFNDSTIAYQGYGRGVPLDDLAMLRRLALGDFAPDLTLILDLSVEDGFARAALRPRRADRFERLDRRLPRATAPRVPGHRGGRAGALRDDRRRGGCCHGRARHRRRRRGALRRDPRMSEEHGPPAPRANPDLVGHEAAEAALRRLFEAGRLPHALLLSGPRGIGKATLAFRLARFVLSEGEGTAADMFGGPADPGLVVSPESGVFRRVASGGHADLLTVERAFDPRRKRLRSEIVVDDAREIGAFLRLTPAEGGWRVVIVDGAGEMNRNAANSLLKILEEPPRRALLVLAAHSPGRLLPTIRSRCRHMALSTLLPATVRALLARYCPELDARAAEAVTELAEGSIGRALELAGSGGIELYQTITAMLARRPGIDPLALHAFADRLARADAEDSYRAVEELLRQYLARHALEAARAGRPGEAAHWARLREEIADQFARTDGLNLDRKQTVLSAFFAIEQVAG